MSEIFANIVQNQKTLIDDQNDENTKNDWNGLGCRTYGYEFCIMQ